MNAIDEQLLKFYVAVLSYLRLRNIDFNHLRLILQAKLMMDNRRPSSFQIGKSSKSREGTNSMSAMTLIVSFIIGLMLLVSFSIGGDLSIKLTVFFSMFIFMLASTLISDFTTVLIDVRDNLIILPKPVTSQTVVSARIAHIAIHITKITMPMVLPSMVALIITAGFVSLIPFLFMLFLSMLFSIFLINATYILILRITTPAKFQSIITYFQIGFAIFIYAFYQLFFKVIGDSMLTNIDLSDYFFMRFVPPYWFAKATIFLFTFELNSLNLLCLAFAIIGSMISIYLVIKYFAPSFNQKLAMIGTGVDQGERPGQKTENIRNVGLINRLSHLLSKDLADRAGFEFTFRMMARSRDFKLKVFPSIGYWIVIFVVMLLQSRSVSFADLSNLESTGRSAFMMLIYFSSILPSSVFANITQSPKSQASWVFFASPMKNPGYFLAGALKAILVFFYLPVALVLMVLSVYIFGFRIVPNLILGLCNLLVIYLLLAVVWLKHFPFSMPVVQNNPKMLIILIIIIIPLIMGFLHFYLIFNNILLVCISIAVVLSLAYLLYSKISKTNWMQIT